MDTSTRVAATSSCRFADAGPNGFFAMAYDPAKKVIVFFGGESRQVEAEKNWVYPDATWMYDGRNWSTVPRATDHDSGQR